MKRLSIFALAIIALAACSEKENVQLPAVQDKVTIEPLITRATEVDFENGDQIGLSIMKGETAYADNALLTFADNVFTGELVWYAEAAEKSTLTAYYPYSAEGAPTSFAVGTDQTAGVTSSDLMGARKEDVAPTSGSVTMVFKHLLSKIVINLDNQSGAAVSGVVLKNSVVEADVDLAAMTVTASASAAADIAANAVTAGSKYQAIVVPQTVSFELEVTLQSGKVLSQKLAEVTLAQGGQYSVDATVVSDDLKVTVSGEIENWEDGGNIEPAPEEDTESVFEEHDTYFVYHGVEYATVTLSNGQKWMAENLQYVPQGYTPSSDPTVASGIWYPYQTVNPDGVTAVNASSVEALTDAASIEKLGYLYDFATALGGVEINVDNCYDFEGVQGICPEGWHIPTRAEYLGLCGLSNKNALGETGNVVDESALFYDANYGAGKISLFDAAGWNFIKSGVRQQSNFSATPQYQKTQCYSDNCGDESLYGQLALTYYLSSTCYRPVYSTSDATLLTNIQFFGMMSTFSSSFPEGKVSCSYASIKAGLPVRCVKDSE